MNITSSPHCIQIFTIKCYYILALILSWKIRSKIFLFIYGAVANGCEQTMEILSSGENFCQIWDGRWATWVELILNLPVQSESKIIISDPVKCVIFNKGIGWRWWAIAAFQRNSWKSTREPLNGRATLVVSCDHRITWPDTCLLQKKSVSLKILQRIQLKNSQKWCRLRQFSGQAGLCERCRLSAWTTTVLLNSLSQLRMSFSWPAAQQPLLGDKRTSEWLARSPL